MRWKMLDGEHGCSPASGEGNNPFFATPLRVNQKRSFSFEIGAISSFPGSDIAWTI
jgi:hypothetical protein